MYTVDRRNHDVCKQGTQPAQNNLIVACSEFGLSVVIVDFGQQVRG